MEGTRAWCGAFGARPAGRRCHRICGLRMVEAAGPPRHRTAPRIGPLHTLHRFSPSLALGFHLDLRPRLRSRHHHLFVRVKRDLNASCSWTPLRLPPVSLLARARRTLLTRLMACSSLPPTSSHALPIATTSRCVCRSSFSRLSVNSAEVALATRSKSETSQTATWLVIAAATCGSACRRGQHSSE